MSIYMIIIMSNGVATYQISTSTLIDAMNNFLQCFPNIRNMTYCIYKLDEKGNATIIDIQEVK